MSSLQLSLLLFYEVSNNKHTSPPVSQELAHNQRKPTNKTEYSSFTKLWQSYSDPHPKISHIAIFAFLFSKLQSRGTLTRQFSPKVAHKDRDKEKITAIYFLWMVDNKRGREW